MKSSQLYHAANRKLQDAFGSRALADRLEQVTFHTAFTDDDRALIENSIYFFLATADPDGRPDCSFKGGPAGFVRVTGAAELVFPDYDGNGMYKSLGNLLANPAVGLLFIDLHGRQKRLRVNGEATLLYEHPLLREMPGAQTIVQVSARAIFPNCARYLPKLALDDMSPYMPVEGQEPLEPAWKSRDSLKDAVPLRYRPRGAASERTTD